MERQFPKNVKQIGNVCDELKIYVEDYVDTYLNQLKENAAEQAKGALLLGEITRQCGQDVVYVSGAVQMPEIEITGTEIVVSEESWKQVEEKKKEYFPDKELVGWCLVENGHPMGLTKGVIKIHERIFSRENSIFVWRDALDSEEIFYAYKYNELMQMGGHYVYYEKNPAMQNYMIEMRKPLGFTPSEMVEDRAAKDFRSTVRGKARYQEEQSDFRFLYAVSVLLVVIVLGMGISTFNNFDKMEAVQQSIDALSQAVSPEKEIEEAQETEVPLVEKVEESEADVDMTMSEGTVPEVSTIQEQLSMDNYYIVEKGDTLDSISLKHYGTIRQVDAICEMNGLDDGNLIFIKKKILLP